MTVLASRNVATEGVATWVVGAGGAGLVIATLAQRGRVHSELMGLESEFFHPLRWLNWLMDAPAFAIGGVVFTAAAGIVAAWMAHHMEARLWDQAHAAIRGASSSVVSTAERLGRSGDEPPPKTG
jgi:hypothetical protein